MANLLIPKTSEHHSRRGSWQAFSNRAYSEDQQRRYSLSANGHRTMNVRNCNNNSESTSCYFTRLKQSLNGINAAHFFTTAKQWNSDQSLQNNGKESQKTINESSSSLRTSPLMSKNDLDKFDFIIPGSPKMSRQLSLHKDPPNMGTLDVTQYLNSNGECELKDGGPETRLGEVKFCLVYSEKEEKVKVILKSVDVHVKPSSAVLGANWTCETVTCVDMLPDKKKALEISYGTESSLDLKKSVMLEKTLRFTVYDSRRRNTKLPIGHVLLPLRDVSNREKINIYSKKLGYYSQPAGFNKGNIDISIVWSTSSKKLEINVGKTRNVKSPHGVNGKEHYVKILAYVSGSKQNSFKTKSCKATPDLNFNDKFFVPLTPEQLKNCSLLFCLYMKHSSKKVMTNKVLTGRTVIGPYMLRKDRYMSQWEKMITSPLEEVEETHTLYL